MRMSEPAILGIDINERDIRIVEMAGRWDAPRILNACATPLTDCPDEDGAILPPARIAAAIQKVLTSKGIRTRLAVITLRDRLATTMALELPPVPEQELRTVVQTELEHYRIIRPGGAFDFVALRPTGTDAPRTVQVVAAASDRQQADMCVDIAERTGLRPLILETRLLSLYRAALPQLLSQDCTTCLAMDEMSCSLLFIWNGQVCLHRHLDIGYAALVSTQDHWPERDPSAEIPNSSGPRMLVPDGAEIRPGAPDDERLARPVLDELLVQVGRSLDYFQRQWPGAPHPGLLVVSSPCHGTAPLADALADFLGISTEMVTPSAGATLDAQCGTLADAAAQAISVLPHGEEAAAVTFCVAMGAAMRGLASRPSADLCLSLSPPELGQIQLRRAQMGMVTSLVASVAVVLLGTVVGYVIGTRAGSIGHSNEDRLPELQSKQAAYRAASGALESDISGMETLRPRGLPIPYIVDTIAGTVVDRAGLTEISIDRGGKVLLSGEATDERSMIDTLNRLRVTPCLTGMSLDSFDQVPGDGTAPNLRFKASAMIVGAPTPNADGGGT